MTDTHMIYRPPTVTGPRNETLCGRIAFDVSTTGFRNAVTCPACIRSMR